MHGKAAYNRCNTRMEWWSGVRGKWQQPYPKRSAAPRAKNAPRGNHAACMDAPKRKRPPPWRPLKLTQPFAKRRYFNCVEMLPKLVLSLVPMPLTTTMITTEMPAAMRPYSMAVAPD
jgi:hypothetical protein